MGFIHLQIEWNPWLGGYRPQIPVLSALCPQLNLLNPHEKKFPGCATAHMPASVYNTRSLTASWSHYTQSIKAIRLLKIQTLNTLQTRTSIINSGQSFQNDIHMARANQETSGWKWCYTTEIVKKISSLTCAENVSFCFIHTKCNNFCICIYIKQQCFTNCIMQIIRQDWIFGIVPYCGTYCRNLPYIHCICCVLCSSITHQTI
jgi:hypothetical protein